MPNFANQKYYLTTKHTKDTKVSDIDIFKLLNFVLFVTFVVICLFLLWLRPCRAGIFVVNEIEVIVPGYPHGSLKTLFFSIVLTAAPSGDIRGG
jgi:hypothetical protein